MFVALVSIGLLILSPFEAAETGGNVNKTLSRQPRHLLNLLQMTYAATGRTVNDFLHYGRYCGFGNAGDTLQPVDKIDECCRYHDACYDVVAREPCKGKGKDIAYFQSYGWHFNADKKLVECEDYGDLCKITLCECDSTVVDCFKRNLDSYNSSNIRDSAALERRKIIALLMLGLFAKIVD